MQRLQMRLSVNARWHPAGQAVQRIRPCRPRLREILRRLITARDPIRVRLRGGIGMIVRRCFGHGLRPSYLQNHQQAGRGPQQLDEAAEKGERHGRLGRWRAQTGVVSEKPDVDQFHRPDGQCSGQEADRHKRQIDRKRGPGIRSHPHHAQGPPARK